ncbi:ammonium transporter [Egibacter rhizosphaerae]|uniref:Ammonium transporter n=2 Tax=Egibacter rhizosphaerae TaxID=1670831 RepID=A0A411YKY8_9ACTN|nr:ammonium transporter [Egibacter rhizosphaerae]
MAAPALAQDALDVHTETTVTFYLLVMVLVFLMHPGFSMLEAGLTASNNAANIMMKNMMVISITFIAYFAVGWGLHYGVSAGGLFGTNEFFIVPGTYGAELGDFAFLSSEFMFDAVFAATAATIVSGAVAGRMNLWGFMVLTLVMTAVIYPVVGHWGWGGGWLEEGGFVDFAGSTIVHLTGGVAAITAAAILGPRPGKYDDRGKARITPGHSSPLAILGVFLLFFGWFGFNGGSVLPDPDTIDGPLFLEIGPVLLTTALAASAGAITAAVISAIRSGGKTDVSMTGNGLLAGLVGITAGADLVEPYAAILVGLVAGILVSIAVPLVERMGVDDAVGAFSVHGVCGVLGTWWVGFYAVDGGLFYGGGFDLASWAIIGTVAVTVFVALMTAVVCYALKSAGLLRVDDGALEEEGLDVHEHGMAGYPEGALAGNTE